MTTKQQRSDRTVAVFAVIGTVGIILMALLLWANDDGRSGERAKERAAIEYCHDNYARLKDDPRLSRGSLGAAYGACEQMEADYRRKWNRNP